MLLNRRLQSARHRRAASARTRPSPSQGSHRRSKEGGEGRAYDSRHPHQGVLLEEDTANEPEQELLPSNNRPTSTRKKTFAESSMEYAYDNEAVLGSDMTGRVKTLPSLKPLPVGESNKNSLGTPREYIGQDEDGHDSSQQWSEGDSDQSDEDFEYYDEDAQEFRRDSYVTHTSRMTPVEAPTKTITHYHKPSDSSISKRVTSTSAKPADVSDSDNMSSGKEVTLTEARTDERDTDENSKRATGVSEEKNRWIRIQVGEAIFSTQLETLLRFPDTNLGRIAEKLKSVPTKTSGTPDLRFDRNPENFRFVLDFYRQGTLHIPLSVCIPYFKQEMQFWDIGVPYLAPCCWERYKNFEDDEKMVENIDQYDNDRKLLNNGTRAGSCRWKLWAVLEYPGSSIIAQIWASFYVLLVLVSTMLLVLDSHEYFRVSANKTGGGNNYTNSKLYMLNTTNSHPVIIILELATSFFFSIEIVVRFISCPSRIRFMKDPLTWAEVTSLVGQWLVLTNMMVTHTLFSGTSAGDDFTLPFLRVFRVFRLLRLARHYSGLQVFVLALKASAKELLMLGVILVIFMIIFSTMIYYAEIETELLYLSIPESFWWSVVTMTTVGYGDVYPHTYLGYLVGAMCGVFGMLATGLPIPIIATNFQVYYVYVKMKERLNARKERSLFGRAFSGVTGGLKGVTGGLKGVTGGLKGFRGAVTLKKKAADTRDAQNCDNKALSPGEQGDIFTVEGNRHGQLNSNYFQD